jgi:sugar/nucleoside kinase (ribokinase family)
MPDLADPIDVIVSGHLCIDLIPAMPGVTIDRIAIPGRLAETGPMGISTGGAVSNTGIALHRLGVNVRLMAIVGDDLMGQAIISYLNSQGPELTRLIEVLPGEPSSYTIILSPADTDRSFLHCPGTNSIFGVDDVDPALLVKTKIFHLGYPPMLTRMIANDGAELLATYQRAKAAGAVTSVDMTLPDAKGPSGMANWPLIIRKTLPYIDIWLPSIEEVLFMLRRKDFDAWGNRVREHLTLAYLRELADEMLSMGAVIAGVKLGELGMFLRTGDAANFSRVKSLGLDTGAWANVELYQPAYLVEMAGTTGAGDSAYAGFLAALLRGFGPNEALQWACAVGACNVEAVDSTSGVRTWQETEARLNAGWPSRSEKLT